MSQFRQILPLFLCALALTIFTACVDDAPQGNNPDPHDHNGHDHDHAGHDHSGHDHSGHDHGDHSGHDHDGHDHASHVMGPHGGHFIDVKAPFKVEWNHEDELGIVSVYLLDAEGKRAEAQENATVKIIVAQGDKSTEYPLDPVLAEDATTSAISEFNIEDKTLVELLKAVGDVTKAKLILSSQDVEYTAEFESHAGHDHAH